MSLLSLNLPLDIPWKRIAISPDMQATKSYAPMPVKWRSSVTVFRYDPQPEQDPNLTESVEDVSYLKISATVTGYQPDTDEVDRDLLTGWEGFYPKTFDEKSVKNYESLFDKYFPALAAIVQVAVYPKKRDTYLSDYPYFSDFEPKKRELIELVTETGEVMTGSGSNLNVRKGSSTTEKLEQSRVDRQGTSFGISAQESKEPVGPGTPGQTVGANYGTTSGSESRTQHESSYGDVYMTTSDASRERRETLSHTTSLSQLYHLLDSYHLGTNRAVFFVSMRPHTAQPRYTFAPGPREIEGVQEFFLVVRRPRGTDFCVEAILETAHLKDDVKDIPGVTNYSQSERPGNFPQRVEGNTFSSNTEAIDGDIQIPPGYRLDTSRGGGVYQYNWKSSGSYSYPVPPGISFSDSMTGINPDNVNGMYPEFTFFMDRVHVHAVTVVPPRRVGTRQLNVTVYIVSEQPTSETKDQKYTETTLFLTGRRASSCVPPIRPGVLERDPHYVAFEAALPDDMRATYLASKGSGRGDPGELTQAANAFGRRLHGEIARSFQSRKRYPPEVVDFAHSETGRRALLEGIDTDNGVNLNRPFHAVVARGYQKQIRGALPEATFGEVLRMGAPRLASLLRIDVMEAQRMLSLVLGAAPAELDQDIDWTLDRPGASPSEESGYIPPEKE